MEPTKEQREAIAYLAGFCDGAIFFACSAETFKERKRVMNEIRAQVHTAQAHKAAWERIRHD